jgi:hypothetical protein
MMAPMPADSSTSKITHPGLTAVLMVLEILAQIVQT